MYDPNSLVKKERASKSKPSKDKKAKCGPNEKGPKRSKIHKKRRLRKRRLRRKSKRQPAKKKISVEKKLKKYRKKMHKKKLFRRKRRVRKHLMAVKKYKLSEKLTLIQIKKRLATLRRKRIRMMMRWKKYYFTVSKPKRHARFEIKKAEQKCRHRKKKIQKYRRMLKRRKVAALQKNNKKVLPKKAHVRSAVQKRVPWKGTTRRGKRVEYERKYPIKATVNAVDIKSTTVQIKDKTTIQIDDYPFEVVGDICGSYGKNDAKLLSARKRADIRFQVQLTHDKTGNKDAKIYAQLNRIGSENSVRLLTYGCVQNVQCVATTRLYDNGVYLLNEYKKPLAKIENQVFVIHQLFRCVRDLHKIKYAHLQVQPLSFAMSKKNVGEDVVLDKIVFDDFLVADKRENVLSKSKLMSGELKSLNKRIAKSKLPKNPINPYMSRRQHFRLAKGVPDDYESWFYLATRIITGKPLPWANIKSDHFEMALKKYEFFKDLKFPDPLTDKKMTHISQYVLSANDEKSGKVGYFIEKILKDWMDQLPKSNIPWDGSLERIIKAKEEENKRIAEEAAKKKEEKEKKEKEKEEKEKKEKEEKKE